MSVNDHPVHSSFYYCFSCGAGGDFIKFLSLKSNQSQGAVLSSCYDHLQSGQSFDSWIEQYEKQHDLLKTLIPLSQSSLTPRKPLKPPKAKAAKLTVLTNAFANTITAEEEEDAGQSKEQQAEIAVVLSEAAAYFAARLLMVSFDCFIIFVLTNHFI